MVLKNKRIFYMLFLALVLLLSGCNGNEKSVINHFYLSMMGESETWNLTGYEVVITPENFKAGNGTLNMKNENEYIADSIHFKTHAVMNGEDIVVHSGSASGAEIDIANESTGAIEGGEYLNEDGSPITLKEVSNIYMTVEWWDEGKSDSMKERIKLYDESYKENTFLE
ncbi:hypothetical protein [Thalassobacillus devorans]|uniref:hypothetical protein n=1 Tax=Thalassobacillus devorans TaxID=279813 RepID=UPI000A1CA336|nr:hypothetical protein [Thalassobacillus devorans]